MNEILSKIKTPAYVCEEAKVRKNLELLKRVKIESGAKVLVALKGFAFSGVMGLVGEYLDGATCSGLYEAKFAAKYARGEIHTYSPAFKDEDIDEVLALSKHVVFNSFAQWAKFKEKALAAGVTCGLRVNPALEGITGLHFHALCEESAQSLETVLMAFEEKFGEFIPRMKWVNFGGGHHVTKEGYDVDLLINLIKNFREKYGVEVYIEPGEAVGWQTGFLAASVLDFVQNEKTIAILDVSAEAHMPDTVLMPYRPAVRGESRGGKFIYRFGGNTCLAGDIVGLDAGEPEYKFDAPLSVGDKVIFEDQIHYTIVKNTTFNGIKLPDLLLLKENGELVTVREFGFEEYERRN